MGDKLPSKYQVGDTVWHARCQWLPVKKPCPICFGKREVKLTLGNGDELLLPCNYCAPGFTDPSGVVSEYEHVVAPEPVTITAVDITAAGGRIKSEYRDRGGCYCYHEENLFIDEDEAIKKGLELKAELDEAQMTKTEHIKHNKAKSFSWNVGYHLWAAKQERASAERHEKLAMLCKKRAKT